MGYVVRKVHGKRLYKEFSMKILLENVDIKIKGSQIYINI